MHILIIGAAGMVGRKLTERLVREGKLAGKTITKATLHDVIEPTAPANAPFAVTTLASTSPSRARPRSSWRTSPTLSSTLPPSCPAKPSRSSTRATGST